MSETRICETCGEEITGQYKDTHSYNGHEFCNYECLSTYYGDDIPEDEDFLSAHYGI